MLMPVPLLTPAICHKTYNLAALNVATLSREAEAAPCTHMEPQRPDPRLGVQLQLEEAFSHRQTVLVELLLSPLPRCEHDRTGDRFLETPSTSR